MSSNAVVVCTWGEGRDGVPPGVEEVLTVTRKLTAAWKADLNWLVLGPMPQRAAEIAGQYGVTSIDRIDDAKLTGFQPDAYVEALAQYCSEQAPKVLLFSQTFDVRLVAPRLAGRLGVGVVMNGVDLESNGAGHVRVTASAYGGDTRVVYEVTSAHSIVGVSTNTIVAAPLEGSGTKPAVRDVRVDLGKVEERVRVVERAQTQGPRLEDAQVIVAGGRGLGAKENFKLVEQLAETLGGLAGASRPIVDDGWIDSSRQVGLTGKITRPVLYIAAGISGASQHMVGCSSAKTLVAINRDPDAPVFRYARYGIVGDCLEILPELIRAAKER
jgi:electron transfer flavoprotein alpha subunit